MSDAVERLRVGIHSYFAEFGPDGCDAVFRAVVDRGALGSLLASLGLPDPGVPDRQYLELLTFLRDRGMDEFHRRMAAQPPTPPRKGRDPGASASGSGSSGARYQRVRAIVPEKPKATDRAPAPGAASDRSAPPPASPKSSPGVSKVRAPEPPKTPEPDSARTSSAGLPMPRFDPGHDPVAEVLRQSRNRVAKLPAKTAGTLPDGSWDGVTERRSGKDRRAGKDRRNDVDIVTKNKRFGGERRKGDRRKGGGAPKK